MDEHAMPKNVITAEDVLRTEIVVNQALIDILIAKHVITAEELVQSIQNIRQDQEKLRNDSDETVSLKQ
jgi:hypothetical protein